MRARSLRHARAGVLRSFSPQPSPRWSSRFYRSRPAGMRPRFAAWRHSIPRLRFPPRRPAFYRSARRAIHRLARPAVHRWVQPALHRTAARWRQGSRPRQIIPSRQDPRLTRRARLVESIGTKPRRRALREKRQPLSAQVRRMRSRCHIRRLARSNRRPNPCPSARRHPRDRTSGIGGFSLRRRAA